MPRPSQELYVVLGMKTQTLNLMCQILLGLWKVTLSTHHTPSPESFPPCIPSIMLFLQFLNPPPFFLPRNSFVLFPLLRIIFLSSYVTAQFRHHLFRESLVCGYITHAAEQSQHSGRTYLSVLLS